MLFVLSAPVTVATWTFHTSWANRGGCRRIRAGGRGAAALTAGRLYDEVSSSDYVASK